MFCSLYQARKFPWSYLRPHLSYGKLNPGPPSSLHKGENRSTVLDYLDRIFRCSGSEYEKQSLKLLHYFLFLKVLAVDRAYSPQAAQGAHRTSEGCHVLLNSAQH